MLEVLVAIIILAAVMMIAFQVFSATVRGWKRGTEVSDELKHGDFAMTELVSALDSTIFFANTRRVYAFTVEKNTDNGLPADTISFVTASSAFMPHDSPFTRGPHRIKLFIDADEEGDSALFVLPMPAVPNPDEFEDEYDADPILVSRAVCGLEILFWDDMNETWTEEWEEENSIPDRIQVSLYVTSVDRTEDPMLFTRLLEIPVYDSLQDGLASPSSTGSAAGGGGGRSSVPTTGNRVIRSGGR